MATQSAHQWHGSFLTYHTDTRVCRVFRSKKLSSCEVVVTVAQAGKVAVSVVHAGEEVDVAQMVKWLFLLHRLFK